MEQQNDTKPEVEVRPLVIGDEVYCVNHARYGDRADEYTFAFVIKLTNTRAILSNNTVLINKAVYNPNHWIKSERVPQYEVYGKRESYSFLPRWWRLSTPEAKKLGNQERIKQKAINFFRPPVNISIEDKVDLYLHHLQKTNKEEYDILVSNP